MINDESQTNNSNSFIYSIILSSGQLSLQFGTKPKTAVKYINPKSSLSIFSNDSFGIKKHEMIFASKKKSVICF